MDSKMDLEKGIKEETSEKIQRFLDSQRNKHNRRNQHSQTICEVPDDMRGPNFQKTIGIGLLNRRPDDDDVKIGYMFYLFERLESPLDDIRNECVHRVCSKFNQITACYGYNLDTMVPNESSQMCTIIVVDACYILSLIYKWSQYIKHGGSSFSNNLLISLQKKRDLIVLDNQIPFFVLQDIFECTILKIDPTASLVELILLFLLEIAPFDRFSLNHATSTDYKHILDLLYKYFQPPDASSSDRVFTVTTTYSAVELRKAGVKFKPYQSHKCKLALKFNSSWGNATLTMPAMLIDEYTAPVWWNLAAYERCYPEVGNYIAKYTLAMNILVDTKEDLLELVESKVIRNNPSGHQYILDTIHKLCETVGAPICRRVAKNAKLLQQLSRVYQAYLLQRSMELHSIGFCIIPLHSYHDSDLLRYSWSLIQYILSRLALFQTYCDIRGL